jgi:pimeloyl-ACP methyl ester carboxylesterase
MTLIMHEIRMSTGPSIATPTPEQVARAFLRPSTRGRPSTLDRLPGGQRFLVDSRAGRIAAASSGEGPAVLLVHGWDGRASDLMAFAQTLLESGFRVIAIDLPAHGDSEGESTSIPASALALLDVQRVVGPLHAVLAHSIGTATSVEAMALGLHVRRAALISAPARWVDYAHAFAARSGLDNDGAERMIEALLALGIDVRAFSMPARATTLTQPVLFVHADDDRVVPLSDAAECARAWHGSRLLRVGGLGHRRILRDPTVVAAVIGFIKEGRA